ncbi:Lysophospholipase L1 [Chitinophaga sp. CF118]|uniref:RICIN domain-containing protein n=1 Tax=Chitinophaga sp. CF118 TaxID=1884367 RepID=UPI0008E0008F|nr:RICIN domain-containing protein [Chitinophaga sp. CF118]SFD99656.1 Lysophospholipase L1 [Chitinophaga sp. CF118]
MHFRKISGILLIAISFLFNSCTKKNAIETAIPIRNNDVSVSKIAAVAGNPDDPNIKYFGRWDFSDTNQYVSYWGGAYIKVNFSGTTVKIKVGNTSNFYAKIDNGAWVSYNNTGGTIDLTSIPLTSGIHSLSVAQGRDYDYLFKFQGLVLDAGAVTSAPASLADLIEYIGDSITAGYLDEQTNVSDYAWVCSEMLHCEHTQIAYPGISLVSTTENPSGMDVQYFKQQTSNYPSSPAWDFTKYTPRVIVINLGTNDNTNNTKDSAFQRGYTSFLANIRTKYPNAEIFVLRTFLGLRASPSSAAVSARNAAGDSKVHYINTAGWLTQGTSDYLPDNLHPSVSGHIKAANLLQPILAPYVGGSPLIADGTYKITNRNSGLVLDAAGQGTVNGTAIQQWSYNGGSNQQWTVKSIGNNQYQIIGLQSGRSLDVTGQSVADGAPIQLYDYQGGNNQKWLITPATGGYYTITAVQSGKVMEVSAQSTALGAAVNQYTSNGGNHQQWIFQVP